MIRIECFDGCDEACYDVRAIDWQAALQALTNAHDAAYQMAYEDSEDDIELPRIPADKILQHLSEGCDFQISISTEA